MFKSCYCALQKLVKRREAVVSETLNQSSDRSDAIPYDKVQRAKITLTSGEIHILIEQSGLRTFLKYSECVIQVERALLHTDLGIKNRLPNACSGVSGPN